MLYFGHTNIDESQISRKEIKMSENVHLCLSDLLDQDTSSNEFFHTLSPDTQKMLMNKDIRTFEELQSCAKAYNNSSKDFRDELLDEYNPACSMSDCTGLVSHGANMGEDDFEAYKQIYPFADTQAGET